MFRGKYLTPSKPRIHEPVRPAPVWYFRLTFRTNLSVRGSLIKASLQETSRSDISQLLPIVAEQLNISGGKNNWQLRYNTLLWLRHLIPINNEITVKSAGVCIRAGILGPTADEHPVCHTVCGRPKESWSEQSLKSRLMKLVKWKKLNEMQK